MEGIEKPSPRRKVAGGKVVPRSWLAEYLLILTLAGFAITVQTIVG